MYIEKKIEDGAFKQRKDLGRKREFWRESKEEPQKNMIPKAHGWGFPVEGASMSGPEEEGWAREHHQKDRW